MKPYIIENLSSDTGNVRSARRVGPEYAPPTKVVSVSGATPSIAAEIDTAYICAAEVSSLTVTTGASSGIFEVVFKAGSTAPEITLPQNVLLPDGFDFDSDTYYDLSVRMCTVGGDSVGLAAVGSWPVPAGE